MVKKNKIDLVSLIVFGVLVLSIVMAIVGICIAWTSGTGAITGKTNTYTLSEWSDINGDMEIDGFGAMAAFAYITLVLTILTAIVFVVSKFVDVKVMKWVLIAVSALLVISAIITIALAFSFSGKDEVQLAMFSDEVAPAAGAWLLSIFGIVGGAAGVVGALKK